MSAYQVPRAGNTDRKAGSTPINSARNLGRQFRKQAQDAAWTMPDWIEINGLRK